MMKEKRRTLKRNLKFHILLCMIALAVLLIPLPSGSIFGSEGDWISQHVAVAESLRQAMREQKTLIPQWIGLGGGSSVYDFSYYGLLRPDVVLSCFFPQIEMKYVISVYAILGVVAAVNLCFVWLKHQHISEWSAFAGAVLFVCASCFYHAHHQIMFVNYMPFLLLALMSVDKLLEKRKMWPLVLSLYFIYVHSYYYAPSCLVVTGLYFLYKWKLMTVKGDKRDKALSVIAGFVFCTALSVGIAAVLLLPTGLDILSTQKDGGQFMDEGLLLVDRNLEGLLYTPYGSGLTILALYCLLLAAGGLFSQNGIRNSGYDGQKMRIRRVKAVFALTLLLVMLLPVVSFVLNAFLYARAKILIPFLPLLIMVKADLLEQLWREELPCSYFPLLLCLLPAFGTKWYPLVLAECGILAVWIYFQRRMKKRGSLLIFLVPFCLSIGAGSTEEYINAKDTRQEHFTEEFAGVEDGNPLYRYDVTSDYLANCNLTMVKNETRTTMYSSVTNADYAEFYYDTMRNPIRIQNRVALLAGKNCFFQYFMGERYLMTEQNNIPAGYKVLESHGKYVLAENEQVLPVCYGTSELLNSREYEKLEYPENMEALCARAVVEEVMPENEVSDLFQSHMEHQSVNDFFKGDNIRKLLYPSKKGEDFILPLSKSMDNQVVLISFDVSSSTGDEVVITINGIKNKLSSKHAPYPNRNHTFTFVVTENAPISELAVTCSKGNYEISNLNIYTMDLRFLGHHQITFPDMEKAAFRNDTDEGFARFIAGGTIDMPENGYFVTSYPWRKGYYASVDGRPVKPERVNTSFVGFPMPAGKHEFSLCYEPPGYRTGLAITLIAVIISVAVFCRECDVFAVRSLQGKQRHGRRIPVKES